MRSRFLDEACISPFSDDAVIKTIPLANFPADMYMVVRALMLLRGLCFSLNLDYNVRSPPLPGLEEDRAQSWWSILASQ